MKDFTPCEHGSHPMGCIQCQLAVQPPATPQEPTGAQLALADIEKAYAETEVALAQVVSRNDKELFFNGDKALRAHLQKNLDYYRVRRDGVRALLASTPSPEGQTWQLSADDVEWVVNDNAELGVKIGNQFFFCYKGHSLVYADGTHDDGRPMMWRRVFKREFGECIHPVNYRQPTHIGTVSLDDSDEWMPLPSPPTPEGTQP